MNKMKLHELIPTVLIKQSTQQDAAYINRILSEDKDPGIFSQLMLLPTTQRDAGRHQGLADMAGIDSDLAVSHPATSRTLLMGLAGAAGGYLGNQITKNKTPEERTTGTAYGVVAGALVGTFIDTMARRRAKKKLKQELLNNAENGGDLSPMLSPGNPAASLISGVHQQGRADALEGLNFGRNKFKGNPNMTVMQLAAGLPVVGPVAGLGNMIGSVGNYSESASRIANANPRTMRNV